ncbi:dihydrofolate reductase family protein [Limosilactobacillus sp.]|uniref:dihydrofolate reductase family protein n=1 Tax=Limosilactobacillus sp. TaxID=2773925 RepID=UPI00345ECE02
MSRPHINLYISTSPNGQITGKYGTKQSKKVFKSLGFSDDPNVGFNFDGWIYGRNTATWFSKNKKPDLNQAATVPDGDYVINQGKERYYISIDRHGNVGWPTNTAKYGKQTASIIEIITEQVTPAYRDFLRRRNIPYLICGKENIDFKLMLDKLSKNYHLKNLMLGGGGILNWTFLDQGLIDEINLVIAPGTDGNPDTARLFNSQFSNNPHQIDFKLLDVKVMSGDTLWVRYKPIHPTPKEEK